MFRQHDIYLGGIERAAVVTLDELRRRVSPEWFSQMFDHRRAIRRKGHGHHVSHHFATKAVCSS